MAASDHCRPVRAPATPASFSPAPHNFGDVRVINIACSAQRFRVAPSIAARLRIVANVGVANRCLVVWFSRRCCL